jgi:hypothetical protein
MRFINPRTWRFAVSASAAAFASAGETPARLRALGGHRRAKRGRYVRFSDRRRWRRDDSRFPAVVGVVVGVAVRVAVGVAILVLVILVRKIGPAHPERVPVVLARRNVFEILFVAVQRDLRPPRRRRRRGAKRAPLFFFFLIGFFFFVGVVRQELQTGQRLEETPESVVRALLPPLEPLQKTLLLSLVSPVRVEHGSAHPPLGRELRFNRGSSLRGGFARRVLFSPLGRVVRETPSRRRRPWRVGVRRGALLRAFPGVARVFAVVHFPALTTARSRLRVVSSLRPIAGASAAAAVASLDASLAFAPLLPLRLLALLRELALLLAVQNSAPSSPAAPTAAATVAARAARPALLPEIALLESGRALFRGGQLELVAHPARQRGPVVPGPAPASAPAAAPAEPTHRAESTRRAN